MRDVTEHEVHLDAFRSKLAEFGAILPSSAPVTIDDADVATHARIVAALLDSADPTLVASIPCLLAAYAERADDIATAAVAMRHDSAKPLGFLYRLARCLCTSRRPDMALLFGSNRCPAAVPFESDELQAPEVEYGDEGIADARYAHPALTTDAVGLFDVWVRQCWSTRARAGGECATLRFRAMLELALRPET